MLYQRDEQATPPELSQVQLPDDCLCVYSVEDCIKATFTSDAIVCPKCGPLDLQFLAPDLVSLQRTYYSVGPHKSKLEPAPRLLNAFGMGRYVIPI